MLSVGDKVPEITLKNQEDKEISIKDYAGKFVVYYFYPKDNTPGCTLEANEFTALKEAFSKKNSVVFGISKDSVASHKKFCDKQNLSIQLLSDPENSVIEKFGAWQLKKNYGKEYMGIVRSTALVDPDGVIIKKWDKVKAAGHAQEVLESIPS